MRNVQHIRSRGSRRPSPNRRKIVVIADNGGDASLVLLDATHPAHAGSHFEHGGQTWVIRGRRHHSRVLVAEPLTTIRQ